MTIDLDQYHRLKKKADQARADADRAEGALEQLMKKLQDDFNCDSIIDAEELLTQFKNEEKHAEESYEKELTNFEGKWGKKI